MPSETRVIPPHRLPGVLVVDDELTPRSIVSRLVRGIGYPVHSSRNGREALRYLKQHPGEIRLLIADLIMPLMDGGELAERACELYPKLHIVLMSSDPLGVDQELLSGYPEFHVLTKPVAFGHLYQVLQELLGPATPRRQRPSPPHRYGERRRTPRDS